MNPSLLTDWDRDAEQRRHATLDVDHLCTRSSPGQAASIATRRRLLVRFRGVDGKMRRHPHR
jgi:hypothetical protein